MDIDLDLEKEQIEELVEMAIGEKSNRDLLIAMIIELCKIRARLTSLES